MNRLVQHAAQQGWTPQTQAMLKRALQVFDFFRRAGFVADDIYLSFDKDGHMGITLMKGEKKVPVYCGKPDIPAKDFHALWASLAEKLPTFPPDDILLWAMSDGRLRYEPLIETMRADGFDVRIDPDNVPLNPLELVNAAFRARTPKEWKDPRGIDTPYRVLVSCCEAICLSEAEYLSAMHAPDALWACPVHGIAGRWDDDWYEARTEDA